MIHGFEIRICRVDRHHKANSTYAITLSNYFEGGFYALDFATDSLLLGYVSSGTMVPETDLLARSTCSSCNALLKKE